MNMWADAFDELGAVVDQERDKLSVDQRLQVAQIKALLSISQELSKIHHEGVNPEYRNLD